MRLHQHIPIPGAVKARAERFFRRNLDHVRLVLDRDVTKQGVQAWAEGDRIHIHPDHAHFNRRASLELLGHELTHVVQQAAGQTPTTSALFWDARLEAQADDWGRRFAHGGSLCQVPEGGLQRMCRQPLVQVGDQIITSLSELDVCTQRVVELIEDGPQWLTWAMGEPLSTYTFPDELNLTIGIQFGLHGQEMMMLREPRFSMLVHPAALMALEDVPLEALVLINQGESNSAARLDVARALANKGLLTFEQLALTGSFLQEMDIANNPLFQNMNLPNQVSLYRALQGSDTMPALQPALQKEASNFALQYAASVHEFGDYYQYYMCLFQRDAFRQSPAGVRSRSARELLESIAASIKDDLQCPQVHGLPTPQQLTDLLTSWVSSGKQIGFARISRGVFQLALQDAVVHATGAQLEKTIEAWLQRAQILITNQAASQPIVAQSGAALYYPIRSETQNAILNLDTSHGFLTLLSFNPGPGFNPEAEPEQPS